MTQLKFLTVNYKSFKRVFGWFQNMLESVDVCLLQETWLRIAFVSRYLLMDDGAAGIQLGRPYGGLGILWRTTLSNNILNAGDLN